jgi:hypothetical protein
MANLWNLGCVLDMGHDGVEDENSDGGLVDADLRRFRLDLYKIFETFSYTLTTVRK